MNRHFWRRIVHVDRYRTLGHPNSAADSVLVTLDCGHQKHYKGSQEPSGQIVTCKPCADNAKTPDEDDAPTGDK